MGSKHVKKLHDRFPQVAYSVDGPDTTLDISDIGQEKNLSRYNALIIATPSTSHYEIARDAIERGQHVLLEKPVTLDYQEAQTLYRLAKEYNVVYMSGHTMRYNPEFRKALPELYHTPHISFNMDVKHENKIENAVFDLMIHGFEIAFNLGQRDSSRDFDLISCSQNGDKIYAEVIIGSKICNFSVSYNDLADFRELVAYRPDIYVDFHASDGQQPDALSNLHDHFIRACNNGTWIDQAEYATAAVQLAEQVQNCLFPGVDPVV